MLLKKSIVCASVICLSSLLFGSTGFALNKPPVLCAYLPDGSKACDDLDKASKDRTAKLDTGYYITIKQGKDRIALDMLDRKDCKKSLKSGETSVGVIEVTRDGKEKYLGCDLLDLPVK